LQLGASRISTAKLPTGCPDNLETKATQQHSIIVVEQGSVMGFCDAIFTNLLPKTKS